MNLKFYFIILSVVTLCFCKSHQRQKQHGIHGDVGMVDGKTKKLENQKEANEDEISESNKRVKSSVSKQGNVKSLGNGNGNSNLGHGVLIENLFNGHDILPALGNANEHIIVSGSTGRNKYSYKNFDDNYENIQDSYEDVFDNYVDSRESYEDVFDNYVDSHESYEDVFDNYMDSRESYGDIFDRIRSIGSYDSFDSRGDYYVKST